MNEVMRFPSNTIQVQLQRIAQLMYNDSRYANTGQERRTFVIDNYVVCMEFNDYFSIGFQMRVVRFPNEYESDFWYHFTNNYINSIYYKNDPNCGACELINQNPLLNQKI